MTDYEELAKALRCENTGDDECGSSDCPYWSGLGCMDGQLMEDAAAAIEDLEARLGEAENSVERWKDMYLTKHEPKRGEWEREMDVNDEPFYQCSVCGECFDSNRDSTHEVFKYCPDCGAKMEVQDGKRCD